MLVAAAAAAVLLLTAESQVYDSNFLLLWEATALLAGDHPYRDFYEWGGPLGAYASAGMQLLVGYRLIGEFLLQWSLIVAGVVIAFRLGVDLSRSMSAAAVMLPIVLIVLATTPTYHYSKLFFFPLTIWLAWRYMERPGPRRSAAFGAATAIAFLFRHDYGAFAGSAFLLALAVTRLATPRFRDVRSSIGDAGAYALAIVVILTPWVVMVQSSEGLAEYVRSRSLLFGELQRNSFYLAFLQLNPVRTASAWLGAGTAPAAATAEGALWLQQITLLVPVLLVGSAAVAIHRVRYRLDAVPADAWRMIVAGAFLVFVDALLLREAAYVVAVAPLTAALSTRFLAARHYFARACAALAFASAMVAAVMWTRDLPVFRPSGVAQSLPRAAEQLFASPPAAAVVPLDGNPALSMRYLHDCTAPGDRVLVTGSTPFQVGYYARRPIAGGHLYWHHRWRSDPLREEQSLALLQRQSVPFAFSTTDPILDDFEAYPRIREYLVMNYVELEGSGGRVLVDARRRPTGTYGDRNFPCFSVDPRAGG